MTAEKKTFLVCYDYGMGGLWGLLSAQSESDIRRIFPELSIFQERPRWMKDEQYVRIVEKQRHDIDETPKGMLKAVIEDRLAD